MAVANIIDRGAQESLHGPSSSHRSNLLRANLRIKMRQLSMVTNDTQWWLIRATEIALVVYVAFYSARSDVWSYVGLVEDFMYKGHRGNRRLNRHGYVMHPTRENQQVKNRLWERVPSPFHIDQTKIRTTNHRIQRRRTRTSSIRRQPRHDRRHSWSWFCCWYC